VDVHSDHHCISVRKRCDFDVDFREGYLAMRPFGSHDRTFDCDVINLAIVLLFCLLFSKFKLEPLVMLCMVPKDGKLVVCWVDSWFCHGGVGGGGLPGSTFV
jgi:hypothetical protein